MQPVTSQMFPTGLSEELQKKNVFGKSVESRLAIKTAWSPPAGELGELIDSSYVNAAHKNSQNTNAALLSVKTFFCRQGVRSAASVRARCWTTDGC